MHRRSPRPTNRDLACCNIDNSAPPLKAAASAGNPVAGTRSYRYSAPSDFLVLSAAACEIYLKPVNQKKTDLRI
jgi:hypothetical protein